MGGLTERRLRLDPLVALGAILLAAAGARAYRLGSPGGALIFDERYYVNAARVILGWHVPAGQPYAGSPAGLDPNAEHPPLGKLLMAGSMRLFGDHPFGWRLPTLLAGLASILLVYAIVRAANGDAWLGVLAAGVFAVDNLALVHSRIATLDMPFVAFLLLGAFFWLRGWHAAAGAACGVAALVKLPAVLGFAALVLLSVGALVAKRWDRRGLLGLVLLVGSFAAVWLVGLWLLDLAYSTYDSPFAHLRYMLNYGFALKGSQGIASDPWRWLVNEVQIPYLRVARDVRANGRLVSSHPIVDFRGAMNPVVIGAAPLAFSYVVWRAWRVRDVLSLWVVAWIATTYLVYYPLVWFGDRTTYIYYFLAALPALAVAIAQLLRQSALPRFVTWGYAVALLLGFAYYYPFRTL